jgi:hypothetical protein
MHVNTEPAKGVLGLLSDEYGNFAIQYLAFSDSTGTQTLAYTVFDGNGGSDDGLVTIQIEPNPELGRGLSRDEAKTVAYLYEAGLDRDGDIDRDGLNYWIDAREAGLSESGVAFEFLRSEEFEAAFGDALDPSDPRYLDDFDFVTALYENVLDRPADDGGRNFWLSVLERPGIDRAALLLEFARSDENVAGSPKVASLDETGPGAWVFLDDLVG